MPLSRRSFIKSGLIFVPTIFNAGPMWGAVRYGNMSAETGGWLTRVRAAGSGSSGLSVVANDKLAKGLIAAGLRTRIKRLNTMTGWNLASACQPLIADVGGASDTTNVFSDAMYTEATGLTPSGNCAMTTEVFFENAPFGENDLAIGVYVRTGSNSGSVSAGVQNGGADIALMPSNGGSSYWDSNNSGGGRISAVDSNGVGFYLGSRSSSSSSVLYKAGTSIASTSNAGGTRPVSFCSGRMALWCVNDVSLCTAAFSPRCMSLYVFALGLDATQSAVLSALVQQHSTILGRNV